jgi:hypothetical protein
MHAERRQFVNQTIAANATQGRGSFYTGIRLNAMAICHHDLVRLPGAPIAAAPLSEASPSQ